MPELVEAEVCAAQLNVALWRATVTSAAPLNVNLIGWTVTGVERVGNAVLFEFANPGVGARFMLSRFGATGHWRLDLERPSASTRLRMELSAPKAPLCLSFIETRPGAGAALEVTESVLDLPYMRYIATTHDVMSDKFDDLWLTSVFVRCPASMTVRQVLVRPEFFPGVGPWIANEALFRAGVDPHRQARMIEPGETAELVRAIILVVSSGVVKGGAAIGAWRNPDGTRGTAAADFCVHGREGLLCHVCGHLVRREKAPGGASFWCPACQR